MEENRKGPGIFYAVVGVATLVVAIIGATFAYFSASANDATKITGNTAEAAGIALNITDITETGGNMIPLNLKVGDTEGKDTVDQFDKAMAGKCKDMNGNNVCDVYKITVTNNSATSTIDVRGDLTLTEGAGNMKWQLLNVTNDVKDTFAASEITGHEVDGTTVTSVSQTGQLVREGLDGATGTGTAARKKLAVKATATYYVLIWLEEMGADQGTDANKTFKGTVNFYAVDATGATSGITASFTQG